MVDVEVAHAGRAGNKPAPPRQAVGLAALLPVAVQIAVIVSGLNGLVQIIRAAVEFWTGLAR
jgi:hypothetical protein